MWEWHEAMPSYLKDFFKHKRKNQRKRYCRRLLITGRDRIYARLYPVGQLTRFREIGLH